MNLGHATLAVAAALGGILAAGAAEAFPAYSAAHLNIRSGPGSQYPVLAQTRYNQMVTVNGCLKDISWCDVVYQGVRGWAAGQYLDYDAADGSIVRSPASWCGPALSRKKRQSACIGR